MPIKIDFFTRTSKIKKNTDLNIRVRVRNGRKYDITSNTGYSINPEFWNSSKRQVRHVASFRGSTEFEKKLGKLEIAIKEACEKESPGEKISSKWLQSVIYKHNYPDEFKEEETGEKSLTLFQYMDKFMEDAKNGKRFTNSGNPIKKECVSQYNSTYKYLYQYADRFTEPDFKDINMDFYVEFVTMLRKNELKDNTIGRHIKNLKAILNSATEHGYNTYFAYKNKRFKRLTQESENIYLNKAELKQMLELDLSSIPRLERVRDLFIVACYTGLRFSDIHKITASEIKDDILFLKQTKTGGKVEIPIHPIVWEILNKYDGGLPPMISLQRYNDYIKEIAKLAGLDTTFKKQVFVDGKTVEKTFYKYELISSHTARRTFCTNAYKDGASVNAIRKISGHRTETSFLKYIKADEGESARELLNIWKNE